MTKTLVSDLMKDINPVYPHDKAGGLAIINSKLIAVNNDDDLGITRNSIYFMKLANPLYQEIGIITHIRKGWHVMCIVEKKLM